MLERSTDPFDAAVNDDVRGQLDAEASAELRKPENVERWYTSLLNMKLTVQAQLTTNKADLAAKQAECLVQGPGGKREWMEYRAKQLRWRAGAVRFLAGVERTLAEARPLRSSARTERFTDVVLSERDASQGQLSQAFQAIAAHKEAIMADSSDDVIELVEEKLWALLDQ